MYTLTKVKMKTLQLSINSHIPTQNISALSISLFTTCGTEIIPPNLLEYSFWNSYSSDTSIYFNQISSFTCFAIFWAENEITIEKTNATARWINNEAFKEFIFLMSIYIHTPILFRYILFLYNTLTYYGFFGSVPSQSYYLHFCRNPTAVHKSFPCQTPALDR